MRSREVAENENKHAKRASALWERVCVCVFMCAGIWVEWCCSGMCRAPVMGKFDLLIITGPSYLSQAGGGLHSHTGNCICMSLIPADVQALGTDCDEEDASPVEIILWPERYTLKLRQLTAAQVVLCGSGGHYLALCRYDWCCVAPMALCGTVQLWQMLCSTVF